MGGVLGVLLANKTVSSVMATGGQLVYDLRGYRYHVFTSAGQPGPNQPVAIGAAGSFIVQNNDGNKLFDVVCVGGGGAGGTTPSNQSGSGGGGGGAVTEFFNIPITLPSPGTPVSFPVYVGAGAGYALPTPVIPASIGGTQFPLGVSHPTSPSILVQFNSRFGAAPLGYTANGGAPAGNYPTSSVSSYGYPAGASGNGNPGGDNLSFSQTINTRRGGSGGGGAGGAGIPGSPWWPIPSNPTFTAPGTYYPTSYPQSSGGIGGIGFTSTIAQSDSPHGNVCGGGGGGGAGVPASFPLPVVPNASGGPGGGGAGGAWPNVFGTEGAANLGGGGGGQGGHPAGSSGPVRYGGPGIVIVRYPYP